MIRSKENAERYNWGENCDGWRLVDETERSIIHERMPQHTSETRHYHLQAKQFFFVLSGCLQIEIEGSINELREGEGIEVIAGQRHRAFNSAGEDVEFLVISNPNTRGDRFEVEQEEGT
ncbi:cupin domain-containing protein [Paenibacillus sp. JX-17]|uniref:Cupin domain-containing protein n=1 Tax=Paenibacillus lacisoli TaxID=3064525 RepID=A0ABT9C8F8_9BACL|nr:cupin domain-containing protein [Paenibacillus sp. JX-17]MDO7905527.1 cupin domain-containing protein [Paenibacillus sp. JX-17]